MIRKMTNNDYKSFIEMGNHFYKSSALEVPIEDAVIERTFENAVNDNPLLQGFIIEHDNKIAGFAMISFGFSTEFGGNIILFEDLYIKPDFQGHGLGSKMFNYLEDTYKEDYVAIKLEVSQVNTRAQALYSALGYRVNDYVSMVKNI